MVFEKVAPPVAHLDLILRKKNIVQNLCGPPIISAPAQKIFGQAILLNYDVDES